MAITAQDVNKLRQMTGAGMMDCKKALTEAEGDFDKAVDLLRKRGQQIASKRADREAKEGVALAKASADNKFAAAIIVNCETDFVAKNEGFVAFAQSVLDLAVEKQPASLEALLALPMAGATVAEEATRNSGVIGEKVEVSAYNFIKSESVATYIHFDKKLATVVGFNQAGVDAQVGKDAAMQVAAMSPIAVDRESIPQATIDHEKEVAIEKTKEDQVKSAVEAALKKAGFNLYIAENEEHINEGIMKGNITEAQAQEIRDLKAKVAAEKAANMPADMVEKIAMGRLNKFFKEATLMEQESVKEPKKSIAQVLDAASKGLKATALIRLSLNA